MGDSTLILNLTVECQHSNKRRLLVETPVKETDIHFRVCDGCAALAERAGFRFLDYPNLTEDTGLVEADG